MQKYYKKWFFPLALPSIILFLFVILIPFLMGFLYSFTSWRGTYFAGGSVFESFVGVNNYLNAFNNKKFISSLIYTVEFTLIAVVVINITALLFALMVNKISKFSGVFKTVFFLPNLLGGLALGFIWQFIFQIVFSQIIFGGTNPVISIPFLTNMLQDHYKALIALVILVTWQMAGYMMIIYITGLNNIPADLYEAAKIDGASSFQQFKVITVPMLMPAITIVFFLTLANCFKLLDQNIALTDGNFNTRLLATQILRTTRDTSPPDYGMAQAQAVIFFVLIASVSLIQVYLTKKKEVEA